MDPRPNVPRATLRPARVDDHAAFTRLFPELQVDDPTPAAEVWATEMVPTTIVATVDDHVVAYLYFQAFASEGIVRHLVVAPAFHGLRIGERLMEHVASLLRARGLSRWALNVKPDNTSALRLYHRMGMTEAYASQSLRFDWDLVERLPHAPPLVAFALTADSDAEVESATNLVSGQLANARALPDRHLWGVRDGARDGAPIVGAAVFVPAFPGAYPFRAATPAAARALLEAVRPFAHSEPPYMQAVIEQQPAIAAALRGAGATVRLDIVHLEGPLP